MLYRNEWFKLERAESLKKSVFEANSPSAYELTPEERIYMLDDIKEEFTNIYAEAPERH